MLANRRFLSALDNSEYAAVDLKATIGFVRVNSNANDYEETV